MSIKYDCLNRFAEVRRAGSLTADDFENGWLKASPTGKKGSQVAAYAYDGFNLRVVERCEYDPKDVLTAPFSECAGRT